MGDENPVAEFLARDLPEVSLDPAYAELLEDRIFLNQHSTWSLQVARIRRAIIMRRSDIADLLGLISPAT